MNQNAHRLDDSPVLPQLEQLLVRAARQRGAPRLVRRKWVLAMTAASLALAGGAAAATSVVQIAGGTTSHGSYSIETHEPVSVEVGEERPGSICLQLRFNAGVPAYGCGDKPSAANPFGLVVADPLGGLGERVIYGLVADEITRVAILHPGGRRTTVSTEAEAGVPGRFFSTVTPSDGQLDLIGYDAAGERVAEIGSVAPPTEAPDSHRQAVEQGDPAGFAPTGTPPTKITYEGGSITPAEVQRLHLSCLEGREETRCYDSPTEAERSE